MFLKKNTNNLRSLFTIFAVFALAATVIWWSTNTSTVLASDDTGSVVNAPEATFAADAASLGAIPDSNVTTNACQNPSTNSRDVTFTVSGLSGNVSNVSVSFNATHTYVQDLEVSLIAPNGATHLLFSATGTLSTTANACAGTGFIKTLSSANTYTFSDAATTNWWTTVFNSTSPVPTSTNRTVVTGIGGAANPPAVTSINAAFAGVTNANGTWTLRFRDRGVGDTGTVTAANLTVDAAGPAAGRLFDFTGSGRTSFVTLARPLNGLINWKIAANPAAAGANNAFIRKFDFGRVGDGDTFGDSIVAADYIGDNRTDVAVYRDTDSTYYVAQTPTGTGGVTLGRAQPWGDSSTDVAGGEGDYDGDGKADFTAVRVNGTTGALTWYVLGSVSNTMRAIPFGNITGLSEPSLFPGADFNADGRDEFVLVSHNAAGTAVTYFVGDSNTGAGVITRTFGNFNTDYSFAPDDYTGDGRADFVAVRETGAGVTQATWYINNSATNVTTATAFGAPGFSATTSDVPVRGDYDGDGRHDIAVWRPSNRTFYWINSSNSSIQSQQFGDAGDIPLGAFGLY